MRRAHRKIKTETTTTKSTTDSNNVKTKHKLG